MKRTRAQLIKTLTKLGARDAKTWADSEAEEDIPQLARYLFLRQAWRSSVLPEKGSSWIKGEMARAKDDPGGPCSGIGPALQRLMDRKVDPKDLTEVVRVMQYQTLFELCYLLEDPGEVESGAEDVAWGLFETDEEGNPGRPMGGLHEDVLGMDPTGREMRPR